MLRQPTIEWQVAGACNYDCTYCIQSKRYRRGRPDAERIPTAIRFLGNLDGIWEIKMSGGEAFAHRLFLDAILPGVVHETPHHVSVLTNFSASRRDLMRFSHLTRGRLKVFSASLHLEFTALDDFADKASWFVDQLDPNVGFVVNQVVLPGKLHEARACRDRLQDLGIRWFPQLYKVGGGIATYDDEADLQELLGDEPGPGQANMAPSYEGKTCWAGTDYFTIDKDGTVWSCRTAKRHQQGRLGNLYEGDVELLGGPAPCPYRICPCTVPANRGMIEGIV